MKLIRILVALFVATLVISCAPQGYGYGGGQQGYRTGGPQIYANSQGRQIVTRQQVAGYQGGYNGNYRAQPQYNNGGYGQPSYGNGYIQPSNGYSGGNYNRGYGPGFNQPPPNLHRGGITHWENGLQYFAP